VNIRRRRRLLVVVAILVGLGLATGLVMYALRSNIDLFYTPSEILNGRGPEHKDIPHPGQRLRIGGMVMPGSVKRDPKSLAVEFKLYDANGVVSVSYVGILPDLFREGQGIVAEGVLEDGNLIKADQVLAKHDEKYTPPEIEDAMKQNHKGPAKRYQNPQGEQQ